MLATIQFRIYLPTAYLQGVSKSFRTGRLERELQMVQLSATRCRCIALLSVSLVSFAAIALCVASQRVFIVVEYISLWTQSGNFWIHPRKYYNTQIIIPWALSLGVKRPGREADHSPPSSAEVKNAWSYTSTPPIRLHGVVLS
jgi:hypothetical protein